MYPSSRDNRGRPRKNPANQQLERFMVYELAREGKSIRAIARELHCSPTTVSNHYSDVYREGREDYIIHCFVSEKKKKKRVVVRKPPLDLEVMTRKYAGLAVRGAETIVRLDKPNLELDRALLLVLNFVVV